MNKPGKAGEFFKKPIDMKNFLFPNHYMCPLYKTTTRSGTIVQLVYTQIKLKILLSSKIYLVTTNVIKKEQHLSWNLMND
jgi:hypothetical protein